MRLRIDLEYDGSLFAGWQVQPGKSTVQGELQAAFRTILPEISRDGNGVVVEGSGRTDAGVHAVQQVASLEWPESSLDCERLKASLNGLTPAGLRVRSVVPVEASFNARRSPHVKCYHYQLYLGRERPALERDRHWYPSSRIEAIDPMVRSAKELVGTHDFSAFRASDCNANTTVRTILAAEFDRDSLDSLSFRIVGKGFLKQMVRIVVGSLALVGQRKMTEPQFLELLDSGSREAAGETAPAHALTLEWVRYLTE